MRSSVVLPEPDGPEQRDQLAGRHVQAHVVADGQVAEALGDVADFNAHGGTPRPYDACRAPLDDVLQHQRDQRQRGQQRRDGERRGELVFVVENLDVQRHRVGLAADVAGDDRHRAELAHRPRVAQDHAVEQRPLDVGQRDAPEGLPARRAQHARGFFLFLALRLHQRDQLARDERERDEHRGQHDARHREDDLHVVVAQPRAQPALQAEQQHEDQPGDHRRDRERQVDQREQHVLAAEVELRDRPGRRDAEHQVQRHRDRRPRSASA